MAYEQVKTEHFRKRLLAKRESLIEELRLATRELSNEQTHFTDAADQAAAEMDRSFVLRMKHRDRDALWQIDEAMKRIEAGTFGECERCGECIAEGRIEAFPFATLCTDCKTEVETEQLRFPGRFN